MASKVHSYAAHLKFPSLLDVELREEDVLKLLCRRTLALVREAYADLGEEALNRCGCCRTA